MTRSLLWTWRVAPSTFHATSSNSFVCLLYFCSLGDTPNSLLASFFSVRLVTNKNFLFALLFFVSNKLLLFLYPSGLDSACLQAALTTDLTGLRVEESVLVLNYKSRGGGRPSTAGRDDLKGTNGCLMLAHLPPVEGRPGYTCNKRVTPADIHGHGSSVDATGAPSSPVALSIMSDLTYEGANVDIPRRALTFLINRFVFSRCGLAPFFMFQERVYG